MCEPSQQSLGDSLFKKTVIPRGDRKWITIDANPSPRSGLPTKVSKMVTKMVRHCDKDECEQDGSCHWETVKSLLLRDFALSTSVKYWIHLIHEGISGKRIE